MAFAIVIPTVTEHADALSVTPRTAMPTYDSKVGLKYYYTDDNVFYRYNYGPNLKYLKSRGGYVRGNCTWYAYSRAGEILGHTFNDAFRFSAGRWYNINKEGNYFEYGSTPRVGAIACYSSHVAIVEKVVNGKPIVSESGWKIGAKPTTSEQLYFHYGTPWVSTCKGYIYIDKPINDDSGSEAKTVNYRVRISSDNLNLRTGPGTSYSSAGYAEPGIYTVTKEKGNWGMIDDEHWVCLAYVTKVTDESSSSSESDSTFRVKVGDINLNMRTGPDSSYTSKGFLDPGTYTIVDEKDGWGKLKLNGYWIKLSYTTRVTTTTPTVTGYKVVNYKVKVKSKYDYLKYRTGPSSNYAVKGRLKPGIIYTIVKEKNGWGQLKQTGCWISLAYTYKVSSSSSTTTATKSQAKTVNYKIKIKSKYDYLKYRTGPGTKYKLKGKLKPGVKYTIIKEKNGWGKLKKSGYWIDLKYTTKVKKTTSSSTKSSSTTTSTTSYKFKVKITGEGLNKRTGPGTSYEAKGQAKYGKVYKMSKFSSDCKWGKIAGSKYWINLEYTKLSGKFTVKISCDDLNMRAKASSDSESKGHLKPGKYKIKAIKDGWGQLNKNGYWICLTYAKLI